ncbi:MAG: PIN domain-containing protein [Candidatus Angelobacter sp.]
MKGRFFLDTNTFVYSFDLRAVSKMRQARDLILEGIATRQGVVSYQVVQEFFNLALRKFEQPMTVAEAEQYLTTVFRPMLSVHSSPRLIVEALRLKERHRLAWYDSLILAAALESRCTILYSEDFQHEQRFGDLRIKNPFS